MFEASEHNDRVRGVFSDSGSLGSLQNIIAIPIIPFYAGSHFIKISLLGYHYKQISFEIRPLTFNNTDEQFCVYNLFSLIFIVELKGALTLVFQP